MSSIEFSSQTRSCRRKISICNGVFLDEELKCPVNLFSFKRNFWFVEATSCPIVDTLGCGGATGFLGPLSSRRSFNARSINFTCPKVNVSRASAGKIDSYSQFYQPIVYFETQGRERWWPLRRKTHAIILHRPFWCVGNCNRAARCAAVTP